jgi:hypothetical protein
MAVTGRPGGHYLGLERGGAGREGSGPGLDRRRRNPARLLDGRKLAAAVTPSFLIVGPRPRSWRPTCGARGAGSCSGRPVGCCGTSGRFWLLRAGRGHRSRPSARRRNLVSIWGAEGWSGIWASSRWARIGSGGACAASAHRRLLGCGAQRPLGCERMRAVRSQRIRSRAVALAQELGDHALVVLVEALR